MPKNLESLRPRTGKDRRPNFEREWGCILLSFNPIWTFSGLVMLSHVVDDRSLFRWPKRISSPPGNSLTENQKLYPLSIWASISLFNMTHKINQHSDKWFYPALLPSKLVLLLLGQAYDDCILLWNLPPWLTEQILAGCPSVHCKCLGMSTSHLTHKPDSLGMKQKFL